MPEVDLWWSCAWRLGLAYLLGSAPFAIVLSRAMSWADPRGYGSKNPGATNLWRGGHRLGAALALLGDAAKGFLAVWLAGGEPRFGALPSLSLLFVVLGHAYPVFFSFRGGKGVATALGGLVAFHLGLAAFAAGVWATVFAFFRISGLAALVAAAAVALLGTFILPGTAQKVAILALGSFVIYRHRENIERLRKRNI